MFARGRVARSHKEPNHVEDVATRRGLARCCGYVRRLRRDLQQEARRRLGGDRRGRAFFVPLRPAGAMGGVSPNQPTAERRIAMTRQPRLSLESLEARALMSAGPPVPLGVSLNSFGTLNIKGDTRGETARVW